MAVRIKREPSQYNFESLDFDVQILSKHYTPLAARDIKYVVIHHMTIPGTGNGSALDACYNTWQKREASAHYGVDGIRIRQFVWDKDYAWACGNSYGNLHGIHIEFANKTLAPNWTIASDTLSTGARLAAHMHKKFKLGRPTSTGFGTGGTLRTHQSFVATACPGPYFKTNWSKFVKQAQDFYDVITNKKPAPKPTPVPTTPKTSHTVKGGDTLWAIGEKYKVTVDNLAKWNNLKKPYIIYPGQILSLKATSTPKPSTPTPTTKAIWGKPNTFKIGSTGEDVTRLGKRIEVWSKALGLPAPYKVGPGSPLTQTDVTALSRIQKKWWPTASTAKGGDADGYPGPETFKKLEKNPVTPKSIATLVNEVLAGKWGNGADRVKRLTDAGYNAKAVQAEVNKRLK